MAELRIVIPAYNEAGRIVPTLRDYCEAFRDVGEIVVVANGCRDETVATVALLQTEYPNLALIDIPARIGKGGAVRVGLSTGTESILGFVDADGSTTAAEFRRLFEICRDGNYDAVVGSRWMRGARVEPPQPLERRIASRTFNAIVRMLFGLGVTDTQCGAKIFRRSAVSEVLGALEVADFSFDIEVLWRLKRAHYSILEVPTVWSDRRAGTKVALVRSSGAMLRSVLRLRLKETVLWRLPLLDRIGHEDIIPVKTRPRVLLLGATLRAAQNDPQLAAFLTILGERGLEVVDVAGERRDREGAPAAGRARAFFWYAFASPRDYDAIVEVAGKPAFIPALSAKPAFVLHTACTGGTQRSQEHVAYRRSRVLDLAAGDVARAAAEVVDAALGGGVHSALFIGDVERLAIHYINDGSGTLERHTLR